MFPDAVLSTVSFIIFVVYASPPKIWLTVLPTHLHVGFSFFALVSNASDVFLVLCVGVIARTAGAQSY